MAKKGNRGQGSQRGGGRVTGNHPLSVLPPLRPQNPKGPLQLQDTLQQLYTDFKLKSENLLPLSEAVFWVACLLRVERGKAALGYL